MERDEEDFELVGLGNCLGDVGVSDLLHDVVGHGDGELTGVGLGDVDLMGLGLEGDFIDLVGESLLLVDWVLLPPGAMVIKLALGCGWTEFWS